MRVKPMTTIVVLAGLGALAGACVLAYGAVQDLRDPMRPLERERQAKHARLTREFRGRAR